MRVVRLHIAAIAVVCLSLLPSVPASATTILVYHSFDVRTSMSISMAAFAAQLDYLEQTGHKVISIDELVNCVESGRNPPEKSVVIAIDDGWATVMRAFPELKRRDLPFTLFLPMAYVGNPYCAATLPQADIDTLKTYPKVTFGNHSFGHSPRLARDEAYAREDIRKSVERFRQVVGHDTKFFAYPYGARSEAYTRMLGEAGFTYLFVTGDEPVSARTRLTAMPRVAANRMSIALLASVLRGHEALMAKARQVPEASGTLVSATPPAGTIPHNVE
jgi:peptidoglycan/xylan/chitin deacetylase (PgdA/CDA1 family)